LRQQSVAVAVAELGAIEIQSTVNPRAGHAHRSLRSEILPAKHVSFDSDVVPAQSLTAGVDEVPAGAIEIATNPRTSKVNGTCCGEASAEVEISGGPNLPSD